MLAKILGYWNQHKLVVFSAIAIFALTVALLAFGAVAPRVLTGVGVGAGASYEAQSTLSLDFTLMINIAFQIINALWPLFVVPMGFMFGLRLLNWIMDEIRNSISK
jgi:hypothetical protein